MNRKYDTIISMGLFNIFGKKTPTPASEPAESEAVKSAPAATEVKKAAATPAAAAAASKPAATAAATTAKPAEATPAANAAAKEDTSLVRPKVTQKMLYYELMNGLYDSIFILDNNGHIVDCNIRVEKMMGFSREEVWDKPVAEIVRGVNPQVFDQMLGALKHGQHVLINAKCLRKDGTEFLSEIGASTMHLTRGENLVLAIRNIESRQATMRKRLIAEIADNPELLKTATEKPRIVLKRSAGGNEPQANSTPAAS